MDLVTSNIILIGLFYTGLITYLITLEINFSGVIFIYRYEHFYSNTF